VSPRPAPCSSPEQARGEKAGPPSDIFSAGAVLYELLAGKRAFPGASLIEAGHATLNAQPASLPPAVPPSLAAIVERSLDKTAGRRFQNGADLTRALEALEPGAPVTLPPRPKGWRRSSSVMVALAALAIGLALASGVRVTRRPSRVEVEVGRRFRRSRFRRRPRLPRWARTRTSPVRSRGR